MSTTPSLPAGDDALNTLYAHVHAPVFFAKLAEHGIVPAGAGDDARLLRMGQQLLQLDQLEAAKAAAARGDLIADAADELDAYFGVQPAVVDAGVKQAADYFSAQGPLLAAALALVPEAAA